MNKRVSAPKELFVPEKSVIIREMVETDISAVTALHCEAFTGYRSGLLGPRFVEAEHRWFLTNYPQLALVSEYGGEVVGFVFGAKPGYGVSLLRDIWLYGLWALLCRPWLLFHSKIWLGSSTYLKLLLSRKSERSIASNRDIDEAPAKKALTLASIAVMPSMQGRGIAGLLIGAFENQAGLLGAVQLRLSVFDSNQAACSAYERAGWRIVTRKNGVITYTKQI